MKKYASYSGISEVLSLLLQSVGFGCGADSSAGIFAALQLLYTAALQKLLVQLTQCPFGEDHVKILFWIQKFYSAVKSPWQLFQPSLLCVYTTETWAAASNRVSEEPFVL